MPVSGTDRGAGVLKCHLSLYSFLAYLFSAAVHLAAGEREGYCIRAAWSAVVEDDTGSIW